MLIFVIIFSLLVCWENLFDHAELLTDFGEGGNTFVEVLTSVASRHLHTDAGLTLGNNGIVEARNIDTLFKELGCHNLRKGCVVEHHSTDGALGGLDVKTCLNHLGTEVLYVLHEPIVNLVTLGQHLEDLDACAHHSGRYGVAEQIGA